MDNGDRNALKLKAMIFGMQEKFDEAKKIYAGLMKTEPHFSGKLSIAISIMKLYLEENDLSGFLKLIQTFEQRKFVVQNQKQKNQMELYFNFSKAIVALSDGQFDKSIGILKDFPEFPLLEKRLEKHILSCLAYGYIKEKNSQEAAHILKSLKQLYGLSACETYLYQIAKFICSFEQRQLEKCTRYLDKAEKTTINQKVVQLFRELVNLRVRENFIESLVVINKKENEGKYEQEKEEVSQENVYFFDALQTIEDAIAESDVDPAMHFLLGIVKVIVGLYTESIQNIEEFIAQDIDLWNAYYWKGVVVYQLEDYAQALKCFTLAQNLSISQPFSIHLQILEAKIFSLLKIGETARARGIVENFMEKHDDGFKVLELFGDIFFSEQNLPAAKDFYTTALTFEQDEYCQNKLLWTLLHLRDVSEAKKHLKSMVNFFQKYKYISDYYVVKALSQLSKDKHKEAADYLSRAEAQRVHMRGYDQKPIFDSTYIKMYKAVVYFYQGRYDKSLSLFEKALSEIQAQRQDTVLKNIETSQITQSKMLINNFQLQQLEIIVSELRFNISLCNLLRGNEMAFLKEIKEIEPSLHEKLLKFQNHNQSVISNVSGINQIKLNMIVNPNKLNQCCKPIVVELFDQKAEIRLSVSLPFLQNYTPVFQFEKFLLRELNPVNFSFQFEHEIIDKTLKELKEENQQVDPLIMEMTQSDLKSCITDHDVSGFSVPRTIMSGLRAHK